MKFKRKKCFIIVLCFLISLIGCLSNNKNIFITDSKNMISILLTLLGLCFTSFSFISASITDILSKSKKTKTDDLKKKLNKLLKSIEDDIFLIFYVTVILIFINLVYYVNIPYINDFINLKFLSFNIFSLKICLLNFIISFIFCLSLYSLYDLIKTSFKLLKNCY